MGHEVDYSPASSVGVKNEWCCTLARSLSLSLSLSLTNIHKQPFLLSHIVGSVTSKGLFQYC